MYVTFSVGPVAEDPGPGDLRVDFRVQGSSYTLIAFPTIAFVMYGAGFWTAPLLMRLHGVSATEVGLFIGLGAAAGGLIGTTTGGVLADWLKTRIAGGRIVIGYICVFTMTPAALAMIYAETLTTAYIMNFVLTLVSSMWAGVPPATANDLVMPRMRAIAGAYYILINTFIGLALGPYVMGKVSDLFITSGMDDGDALRLAIALSLLIFLITLVCLVLAQRQLPKRRSLPPERARALGEPV